MDLPLMLISIIVLALIFDYINGFHDSANSIAAVISTKVLTPLQAVAWAAFFNFVAFFISKYLIGEFKVGNTIANSVHENFINLEVILSGLHLEFNYLVVWHTFQLISHPHRWFYWCGTSTCWRFDRRWSSRYQLYQSDSHIPIHIHGSSYWYVHRPIPIRNLSQPIEESKTK